MKITIITLILLYLPILLWSQGISFNYPLAGSLTITESVSNDKSKDGKPFTINLTYYYKKNVLNYYLAYSYEDYQTERIKIQTRQYDMITKAKTYTFLDSAADVNFRFFRIHNFIDSNYIKKQTISNSIKKTDTVILKETYTKYSFRFIEDSVSFGNEEKMALRVVNEVEYLVHKKNNRMCRVLSISNSSLLYIKDNAIASNWKEENINEVEKFMQEKERFVINNYTNSTNPNKDSMADVYTLKTTIKPADIQALKFNLIAKPPLKFTDIKEDYILLDFWFKNCPPCLRAISGLNELQRNFNGKLKVIGIDVQKEDAKDLKKFIKEKGIEYEIAADYEKAIHHLFNITVCPTWLLYDKTGKYIDSYIGYSKDSYQVITKAIISTK